MFVCAGESASPGSAPTAGFLGTPDFSYVEGVGFNAEF